MLPLFRFEEVLKDVKRSAKATNEVPEEKLLSIGNLKTLLASAAVSEKWRVMIQSFVTTGLRVPDLTAIRVKDRPPMPYAPSVRSRTRRRLRPWPRTEEDGSHSCCFGACLE